MIQSMAGEALSGGVRGREDDPVPDLLAKLDRQLALLKELEWAGLLAGPDGAGVVASCPVCNFEMLEGHGPECRLAAELKD